MAGQNSSRNELAMEITWLRQRKERLQAQYAAQISKLAALEREEYILKDLNIKLKEHENDLQVQIKLEDALIEETKKEHKLLMNILSGKEFAHDTTIST